MKTEYKQKWIDALRSGKYKQGRGILKTVDGEFCCLGVLCDVYNNEGWVTTSSFYEYNGFRFRSSLSYDISKLFDLTNSIEDVLIYMNDTEEKTFEQIADWIEVNL